MQPTQLNPLLPTISGGGSQHKPKSVAAEASAAVIAPTSQLVTPGDALQWQTWQTARDAVVRDRPEHAGLDLYQAVADEGLRQKLQQMVGVDLYV
ncbi:hypothetical protein [Ferrimonas pelagia]|uniref:Uncharacterized protein n=1 Tax=Ferrimonas pelagia TaxID=1177826 RepID=A0ABP9FJ86_9GAMM